MLAFISCASTRKHARLPMPVKNPLDADLKFFFFFWENVVLDVVAELEEASRVAAVGDVVLEGVRLEGSLDGDVVEVCDHRGMRVGVGDIDVGMRDERNLVVSWLLLRFLMFGI